MVQTKITDANQTQVPATFRERYRVGPGDVVIWEDGEEGTLRVTLRPRRRLRDMVGIAPGAGRGDAVAAKKRAQRGERL